MPTQRPSKGGPVPKGSRTGGLITMSGRRTEVNKHQIRWSLTKTHKDLSTRYWLLERACEPDQVPARPGPGLIPRPEHQAPKPQSNRCCSPPPVLRTRTSHQPPRARHQAPRPDQATEDPSPGHPASAGTNPPGNRVHQTAEESFHSRATCENPGTYCRIGFSYKSLRQPPPPAPLSPSARNQRHKVTDTLSMKFLIVTGESGDIRSDPLSLRRITRARGASKNSEN